MGRLADILAVSDDVRPLDPREVDAPKVLRMRRGGLLAEVGF